MISLDDGPGDQLPDEALPWWAWPLLVALFVAVAVVCAAAQGVTR